MVVPLSKEEIHLALEGIYITDSHQKHQDRAVAHIINYIEDNIEDVVKCYSESEKA